MDFIKHIIFWLWNPKSIRDSTGRIIPDHKRRKHSKQIKKDISTGKIKLKPKDGDKPRCYKIMTKRRFVLKKLENK